MARSRATLTLVCAAVVFPGWVRHAYAQSGPSAGASDPLATIRAFDRRLRTVLRRRVPSWSPEADLAQLQIHQLVDDTVSISELAHETLGRHWNEATDAQRSRFVGLFREILARRIASGQLLDYEPESGPRLSLDGNGVADVTMIVRPRDSDALGAQRAALDYRLRYLGGRWQLIDLRVDDQSMVDEYRYQFDRIITRERLDGLLEKMRRKVG